jgi:hypothetical protein
VEEDLEEGEVDKDKVLAVQPLVDAQAADTQFHTLVEHHAPA